MDHILQTRKIWPFERQYTQPSANVFFVSFFSYRSSVLCSCTKFIELKAVIGSKTAIYLVINFQKNWGKWLRSAASKYMARPTVFTIFIFNMFFLPCRVWRWPMELLLTALGKLLIIRLIWVFIYLVLLIGKKLKKMEQNLISSKWDLMFSGNNLTPCWSAHTWFLKNQFGKIEFNELDFYCLCSLQKSIT